MSGIIENSGAPLLKNVRPLPEDPGEMDKALAPHRIYARMPIKAVSSLCENFDTDPLDAAETAAGIDAVAMCFYQYQAGMNCWFALAMFGLGIGVPRTLQYLEAKKAKKKPGEKPLPKLVDSSPTATINAS